MLQVVKGAESALLPRLRFLSRRNNSERKSVEDAVFSLFFLLRTQDGRSFAKAEQLFHFPKPCVVLRRLLYFCQHARGSSTAIKDLPDSCLEKEVGLPLQGCLVQRHKRSSFLA